MSYNFLKLEKSPKILVEAYKLIGTKELLGKDNNPTILKWAEELGLKKTYTADEIPWCGLFIAYVVHKAGKEVVANPLWARNWLKWGSKQSVAMLGDVLIFSRGATSGHVGIYVGEDTTCYHVLGGNQSDQVSIVRIVKSRLLGIRRTKWSIAQPANVRVIQMTAMGVISNNEQ
jgi:uncharacterized protein (TIGR02594 family)